MQMSLNYKLIQSQDSASWKSSFAFNISLMSDVFTIDHYN